MCCKPQWNHFETKSTSTKRKTITRSWLKNYMNSIKRKKWTSHKKNRNLNNKAYSAIAHLSNIISSLDSKDWRVCIKELKWSEWIVWNLIAEIKLNQIQCIRNPPKADPKVPLTSKAKLMISTTLTKRGCFDHFFYICLCIYQLIINFLYYRWNLDKYDDHYNYPF
jgi:hypothetical protein